MTASTVSSRTVPSGMLLRRLRWDGLGGAAARLQLLRDQEGELQRLLGIEPRVAEGGVIGREIRFREAVRATQAFRDIATGHFHMYAAGVGALGLVHVEEA